MASASSSSSSKELVELLGWAHYVRKDNVYVNEQIWCPKDSWADCGPLKELLIIGSEGASAWGWVEGTCVGSIGSSEKEAICKTAIYMLKLRKLKDENVTDRHPIGCICCRCRVKGFTDRS